MEHVKKFGILLGLVLLHLLTSFSIYAAESGKYGGTLRFATFKDVVTLNPFQSTRSIDRYVRSLVFEPLLVTDKNGNVAPNLAESWRISRDGKEYTFQLKSGVRFHSPADREMSAEDVKWCVEYALDPKNSAYGRSILTSIKSTEVVAPHSIRFTLKEPYAPLLATFATIQSFPVIAKNSIPGGTPALKDYPPATGPYQMKEWRTGQSQVFKKFASYWQKGIPYLDEVILKPIADENVRLTALRTGDVDLIERVPFQTVDEIRKGRMGDLKLAFANGGGFRRLTFNVQKPPLDQVKVRQAVAYAIDKEEIKNGEFWGLGEITAQKVTKGSEWHVEFADRKRDIEKAKSLLKESGFPQGLKIRAQLRRGAEGELQLFQKQLKDVGIDLSFEVLDAAAYTAKQFQGEFELIAQGGSTDPDPDMAYYPDYHCEKPDPEAKLKRVINIAGYCNPAVDRLLDEGRRSVDKKQRAKVYREFLKIVHEEVPQIPYIFYPYVFAYGAHLRGFDVDVTGLYFFGQGGIPMAWMEKK
jgi:peptide/nickel transport system substrate-binding protein